MAAKMTVLCTVLLMGFRLTCGQMDSAVSKCEEVKKCDDDFSRNADTTIRDSKCKAFQQYLPCLSEAAAKCNIKSDKKFQNNFQAGKNECETECSPDLCSIVTPSSGHRGTETGSVKITDPDSTGKMSPSGMSTNAGKEPTSSIGADRTSDGSRAPNSGSNIPASGGGGNQATSDNTGRGPVPGDNRNVGTNSSGNVATLDASRGPGLSSGSESLEPPAGSKNTDGLDARGKSETPINSGKAGGSRGSGNIGVPSSSSSVGTTDESGNIMDAREGGASDSGSTEGGGGGEGMKDTKTEELAETSQTQEMKPGGQPKPETGVAEGSAPLPTEEFDDSNATTAEGSAMVEIEPPTNGTDNPFPENSSPRIAVTSFRFRLVVFAVWGYCAAS